jgi:hypothetical protein
MDKSLIQRPELKKNHPNPVGIKEESLQDKEAPCTVSLVVL